MPSPNPDDFLLLIRCPSCGQRFKVGEDLRGRTVECGGCEHRFRIGDEVIVRGRKFYPGERKDPTLNRFHRVPLAIAPVSGAVSPVQYAGAPDPSSFEPASPLRVIAGLAGIAWMAFIALLLMFGASRGGVLDGMTTGNRLVMAGFAGLLGLGLLVYANRRARLRAMVVGLLLTVGLFTLPLFFTEGSVPLGVSGARVEAGSADFSEAVPSVEDEPEDSAMRNLIGTKPLDAEIARLAAIGSPLRAVGLWLRGLNEANRLLVRDYLLRSLKADPQSHFYPRGESDFLMVVTGIDHTLEEVKVTAAALGTVVRIYPELSVMEVQVNNDAFRSGPIEKLADRTHPAFYDLNKRELESIDLQRVSDAVKRLAEAEPKIYRSDISRKLVALLGEDWVDFKASICKALMVWQDQPGPAGEVALKEVKKLMERDAQVPEEMIALIVKEKTPGVIPVIDQLWSEDHTRWEESYSTVGPAAEPVLIRHFPEMRGPLRHSLVRLLGRVGGKDSLPVLDAALDGADSELKILIRNARDSIEARLNP